MPQYGVITYSVRQLKGNSFVAVYSLWAKSNTADGKFKWVNPSGPVSFDVSSAKNGDSGTYSFQVIVSLPDGSSNNLQTFTI